MKRAGFDGQAGLDQSDAGDVVVHGLEAVAHDHLFDILLRQVGFRDNRRDDEPGKFDGSDVF